MARFSPDFARTPRLFDSAGGIASGPALRPDHRDIGRVDDRRDFLMDNQPAASITTNGVAIPKMEINSGVGISFNWQPNSLYTGNGA